VTETDAVIYRYFKVMQDIVYTYGVPDKDAIRMRPVPIFVLA
jgi:hypothetical protein